MNQKKKGTGKIVGAVISGIMAGLNGFIALACLMASAMIATDPSVIYSSLEDEGIYGPDLDQLAEITTKIVYGMTVFFVVVTVIFVVVCVMLIKSYNKLNKAVAQPYGGAAYNQYQANPYQNAYQNPYAQGQAQQPQFQGQQPVFLQQAQFQAQQPQFQQQAQQPVFQQQPQFQQPQQQNTAGTTGYNNTQNQ